MDLPPPHITGLLLDDFLSSVHWFVLTFHEPTLRAELETVLTLGSLQPSRLPFLILVLTILLFGSKYTNKDALEELDPDFDLDRLRSRLLRTIEQNFLDIFEEGEVEGVQAGVLLTTYYFYHARPKRAYVVLGASLKSAKAMGLFKESKWVRVDLVTREIRKRAWWALYAADQYVSFADMSAGAYSC